MIDTDVFFFFIEPHWVTLSSIYHTAGSSDNSGASFPVKSDVMLDSWWSTEFYFLMR